MSEQEGQEKKNCDILYRISVSITFNLDYYAVNSKLFSGMNVHSKDAEASV